MRALLAAALVLPATVSAQEGAPVLSESKIELFVTDVTSSARFYETLGFEVAQRKDSGYTTLENGSTVIALSPVPWWLPLRLFRFLRYPPLGTEIVLYTTALEELRKTLESAGYEPGPIALQSWGDRDFRITDYDGYYVRISEGQAVPVTRD